VHATRKRTTSLCRHATAQSDVAWVATVVADDSLTPTPIALPSASTVATPWSLVAPTLLLWLLLLLRHVLLLLLRCERLLLLHCVRLLLLVLLVPLLLLLHVSSKRLLLHVRIPLLLLRLGSKRLLLHRRAPLLLHLGSKRLLLHWSSPLLLHGSKRLLASPAQQVRLPCQQVREHSVDSVLLVTVLQHCDCHGVLIA